MNWAWVPFPAPGGPTRTMCASPQEALVVTLLKLAFDLLYRLQAHADDDRGCWCRRTGTVLVDSSAEDAIAIIGMSAIETEVERSGQRDPVEDVRRGTRQSVGRRECRG